MNIIRQKINREIKVFTYHFVVFPSCCRRWYVLISLQRRWRCRYDHRLYDRASCRREWLMNNQIHLLITLQTKYSFISPQSYWVRLHHLLKVKSFCGKKDFMVAINLSNAQKLFTNITQSGICVILLDWIKPLS